MNKNKKVSVSIIASDDAESVKKRAERGEFNKSDEVIVGSEAAIKRLMEILSGLDDDGNPI
jgi:hypothetical protein